MERTRPPIRTRTQRAHVYQMDLDTLAPLAEQSTAQP